MELYLFLMNFSRPFIKLKFAPWSQTAGFGVFAGQAFKKDEMLPATWKTLFLPANFPTNQPLRNSVFGHNKTHMALALDYGSVLNHHESANVHAVHFTELPPGNEIQFQVCMGFVCGNRIVLENAVCMHVSTHTTDTRTHIHFQGHKRYRGWTGSFGPVWPCRLV